jgi:hypothetical protein
MHPDPLDSAKDVSDSRSSGIILDDHGTPYSHKTSFPERLERIFDRIPHGEKLMIFLTGIIALSAIVTLVVSIYNNIATGLQVGRLIGAANHVADAAGSFSDSAKKIDEGIDGAVSKLNDQARALNEQTYQSRRLADETNESNNNVISADRPWLGSAIVMNTFAVGQKPAFTFIVQNFGKRPAKLTTFRYRFMITSQFPINPEATYLNDAFSSTGVLMPTQQFVSSATAVTPLDQSEFNLIQAQKLFYYAFAKAEYVDPRTNKSYWTHFCITYNPLVKNETDNGFRSCGEYNETK